MSIAFKCSKCGKAYKLPDTMAGRKGKCTCGAIMQIPADSPPARKGAAKRGGDQFDFDSSEPPAKTKPERRKAAPVEEEAEEPSGRSPLLLVGIGVVALLVLGGGGWAAYKFVLSPEPTPVRPQPVAQNNPEPTIPTNVPAPTTPAVPPNTGNKPIPPAEPAPTANTEWTARLQYLPDACQALTVIRPGQIAASEVLAAVKKEIPVLDQGLMEFKMKTSFDPRDLDYMLIGGSVKDASYAAVLQARVPIDLPKLLSSLEAGTFTEEKVGKYTTHKPSEPDAPSVCLVDEKLAVFAPAPVLQKILMRDAKAELTPGLQGLVSQLDPAASIALAADVTPLQTGDVAEPLKPGLNQPQAAVVKDALKDVQGLSLVIKMQADVQARVNAACKDAEAATNLNNNLQKLLEAAKANKDLPKLFTDILEATKITASDTTVNGTVQLTPASLVEIIKIMMLNAAPPGPMGNNPNGTFETVTEKVITVPSGPRPPTTAPRPKN